MTTVTLGSVVRVRRRILQPQEIDPAGRLVLLEHIGQGTGEVRAERAGAVVTRSAKAAFESGDVLFGTLRPGLRKSAVATSAGACSTDIAVLTPVHDDSAYYLAALMRSDHLATRIATLVAGASLPRVRVRELLELEVPWPESKQLVRLNELARGAVEVRDDIAAFIGDVDALERAVVASAFDEVSPRGVPMREVPKRL